MKKLAVCADFITEKHRLQIQQTAEKASFSAAFFQTQAALAEKIGDFEVLYGYIPPELLAGAKELRWLCTASAGVDHLLEDSLWPRPDCLLSNSSGAYGPTISEHIVMVLLMLLRRMPEYEEIVRARGWENQLPIRSIRDGAFTILGTGDIGAHVADCLRGMGAARITGLSRSGRAREGFDEVLPISRLDEVLPRTQSLIMALPGTAETVHILNRARIALLPAGATVINVGRGTAVEQEPLIEALNAGRLGGAALDVMDPEPLPEDHPLWSAKNIILTPHVSGNMTLGYTRDRNVEMFCEDLRNYAAGRPLNGLVDRKAGY